MIQFVPVARTAKFMDECERGAAHRACHAPSGGNALRQTSLASTQFAFQANPFAASQQFAQTSAQAARLLRAATDEFKRVLVEDRHSARDYTPVRAVRQIAGCTIQEEMDDVRFVFCALHLASCRIRDTLDLPSKEAQTLCGVS